MPFRRREPERGEPKVTTGVPTVPGEVVAAAALDRGERLLAGAQDDHTADWVLVTTWRLLTVGEGGRTGVDRPWHDVDAGAWDPDAVTLSLSWVGAPTGLQWTLRSRTGPGRVPEAFRERVGASVVLARHLDLGPRRSARVVIRKDLRTRELLEQVILGRAARADDAELAEAVERVRREVRDQAGLPPEAS